MNLGEKLVHNICTGEQTSVQWGSVDWFMFSFAAFAITATVAGILIPWLDWVRTKRAMHRNGY